MMKLPNFLTGVAFANLLLIAACKYDSIPAPKPVSSNVKVIVQKNFVYVPDSISVNAGDTVQFQWESGNHPTVSDNNSWATFTMDANNPTKDVILTLAGTYMYHCSIHGAAGGVDMAGKIIVK